MGICPDVCPPGTAILRATAIGSRIEILSISRTAPPCHNTLSTGVHGTIASSLSRQNHILTHFKYRHRTLILRASLDMTSQGTTLLSSRANSQRRSSITPLTCPSNPRSARKKPEYPYFEPVPTRGLEHCEPPKKWRKRSLATHQIQG